MICASIQNIQTFNDFRSYLNSDLQLGGIDTSNACLTFDDGPSIHTLAILKLLEKYSVKASFYMLGSEVQKHPDIAREVANQGHLIGSHGFYHENITQLSNEILIGQLQKYEKVMDKLGISINRLFRPPFGEINKQKIHLLKSIGYTPVLWSKDSFDWKLNSSAMSLALAQLTNLNETFLFHDGADSGSRFSTLKTVHNLILMCFDANIKLVPNKFKLIN